MIHHHSFGNCLREADASGSNPVTPTSKINMAEGIHPDPAALSVSILTLLH
jgi:hypothetical protein